MRGQLKQLNIEMWKVLTDPRASRLERLEAGRIIASLHGILVAGGLGESALSTRDAVALRAAQREIAEKLFKRKNQKKNQNRRRYLRRKIEALEVSAAQPAASTPEQKEESNGSTK